MATRLPTISLLHATYRRSTSPVHVKEFWLRAADQPQLIDYIFALDEDDFKTITATDGHKRVVGPALANVTAVRNWNAAAGVAVGDLLVVIADDLIPPLHWDSDLRWIIGHLDPQIHAFSVKTAEAGESGRRDLLRHPVISRAFYQRFGLFSDLFTGVFCDDDITLRALFHAAIVDGRALRLQHDHPSNLKGKFPSESQNRINKAEEFQYGREALNSLWSPRRRAVRTRFLRPGPGILGANAMTIRAARLRTYALWGPDLLTQTLTKWRRRLLRLLRLSCAMLRLSTHSSPQD